MKSYKALNSIFEFYKNINKKVCLYINLFSYYYCCGYLQWNKEEKNES